jgi:hypothetical protein
MDIDKSITNIIELIEEECKKNKVKYTWISKYKYLLKFNKDKKAIVEYLELLKENCNYYCKNEELLKKINEIVEKIN